MRHSASTGVAEKAIQEVTAQLRTMLLASEVRLGKKVPFRSPLMYWLTEHVAGILNRCKLQDRYRKTSYQRKYGKKDLTAVADFGEIFHYMPLGVTNEDNKERWLTKAEPRLHTGVYQGFKKHSNDYRVGAADGSVVNAYALKRLPRSHQWLACRVDTSAAFPWAPSGRQTGP